MGYQFLLDIIEQIGYVALFLVLCLGLIGLPIPNEAVVLTGGALSASGILDPIPAYLMTFLGICSAMTFNYAIGRFAGSKLFDWFMRKKNIEKFVTKAHQLNERYGGWSLGIGLLLPFLRHVMPFVAGTNRMNYARFAMYAYPSALIWTLTYFIIGSLFGDHVEEIGNLIYEYGVIIVLILAAVAAAFLVWHFGIRSRSRKNEKAERNM
ncbi:DedA family protein [Paenibacillus sp. NEAU-GSW1]|uniref:DedA family protein n=1 Tax=Paenibacillus sp. NEAU-GSW1 TaxID=2682486 RepID=UPI0012E23095|nr:DedA family protein [Paenibacillus sp. NEAU-GSW1]MUT67055.1 DedA family protein [Paenibacillus sp. NEAU-GSW1]